MSSSPLLELRDLHTRFETTSGVVRAVDGVTLTVRRGQRVGIVGESGSGKTQTFFSALGLSRGYPGVVSGSARFASIELLAGLESCVRVVESAGGRVVKDTHRWSRLHEKLVAPVLGREIAVMFQDPRRSLIPYWNIGRHLSEVIREPGRAAAPASVLESFGFADPHRVARALPSELSGGEAQRALLAMTMSIQPSLLIADEPTTGLDAINQAIVLGELQRALNQDLAMVLISHDLAVIQGMVDHVYVMFGGRVVESAPANVVFGSAGIWIHPYTARLREGQERRAAGLLSEVAAQERIRSEPAVGCSYAGRCALRPTLPESVQLRCRTHVPPHASLSPDHAAACWAVIE